jgi:hypothetical protein
MELTLSGIRPSEEQRFLWVGVEGEPMLPIRFSKPETPPTDPDSDEPTTWIARAMVPLLPEGAHRIGIGDDERLRSELVDIQVVHPEPRLEHAVAGAAIRDGLRAFVSDLRELAEAGGDPDLARGLAELSPDDMPARWAAYTGGLDTFADGVFEDWMAIPEADRAAVQALFDNSGVLPFLEAEREEGPPPVALTAIPLLDRIRAYAGRPAHAALFTADLLSYVLKIAGTITDAVEIAAALSGVGLPAAAAAFGIKLIIALVKVAIDTFLPTDLMSISVHGQDFLYHDSPEPFVFYGVFSPQNAGGAVLQSFEDFFLVLLAEALPGPAEVTRVQAIRDRVRDVASFVLMRVPGAIVEQMWAGEPRARNVTVPVTPRIYQITFGELATTFPPTAVFSGLFEFFDFDLVTSLEIADGHPDFADDAELLLIDPSLAIRGVPWPGIMPIETATFDLSAAGFRFGESGVLFKIPGVTRVRHDIYGITVQNMPAPGGPRLALYNNTAFILDEINLVGGGTGTVVTRNTTDVRVYQITLRDEAYWGATDPTRAGILVNGVMQHTGLFPGPITVPIVLEPGSNTVTIVAESGDDLPCEDGVSTFCVNVEIAQSVNDYRFRFAPLSEGGFYSFQVWTPPRFTD